MQQPQPPVRDSTEIERPAGNATVHKAMIVYDTARDGDTVATVSRDIVAITVGIDGLGRD